MEAGQGSKVGGARRGGPATSRVLWCASFLALAGSVAALVVPTTETYIQRDWACGSALRPRVSEVSYVCERAHGLPVAVSVALFVVALLCAGGAWWTGSGRRDAGRALAWAAPAVVYFVLVTWAALVTYPYAWALDRGEGGGGLEYLVQYVVGMPTTFLMPEVGMSVEAAVLTLYVGGLVQVACVGAFCLWGFRWTDRRDGRPAGAPVA